MAEAVENMLKSPVLRPLSANRARALSVKTARELAGRLIETNLLGPAGLPEALSLLIMAGRTVLSYEAPEGVLILKPAKEICLKLIERHRLSSPQTAALALVRLGELLARAAGMTTPANIWLLGEAKELTIKMIESNRLTGDNLNEFFLNTLAALNSGLE